MNNGICDLKLLEELSIKVVEISPDAMVAINEQRQILIFNAQAEFMFGHAREGVLGQEIEILLPDRLKEGHSKYVAKWFRSPGTREMGSGVKLMGRHRSGEEFQIQVKLAPLMSSAGLHALAVIRRGIE